MKMLKKITFWFYLKYHSIMTMIGIALYNTEQEILKADPNALKEGDKHVQRMRHRNILLEKFYAGKSDKKYVREYYEVLKKADKFIKTATPHQMAVAADKYGTSYGMKDKYGRRYEHYGFFDDKHKNVGKTIGEVLVEEFEERRTKDDTYQIQYIFNNKPIEVGLVNVFDSMGKKTKGDEVIDIFDINKSSTQFKFPLRVGRTNENAINKIEELSEFLHVKIIGFEFRQLEFFVPLKFKTNELEEDSDIFKEIIDIQQLYVIDDYGALLGFGINKFIKRIKYNDTHEVLKFEGIEMEMIGFEN